MGLRRASAIRAAFRARTPGWTGGFLFAGILLSAWSPARAAHRCYSPAQAPHHLHHKTCIQAHVYREINLDDGTRILDLCGPQASDCEFAIVSLDRNRKSVGSLKQYVGSDIEVFGTVEPIRSRAEILLRKAGQLHSRDALAIAEAKQPRERRARQDRFHANPTLLKSFNAEQTRMPVSDPAFRAGYGGYSN
jgi:hypothetical protein